MNELINYKLCVRASVFMALYLCGCQDSVVELVRSFHPYIFLEIKFGLPGLQGPCRVAGVIYIIYVSKIYVHCICILLNAYAFT